MNRRAFLLGAVAAPMVGPALVQARPDPVLYWDGAASGQDLSILRMVTGDGQHVATWEVRTTGEIVSDVRRAMKEAMNLKVGAEPSREPEV